MHYPKPGFNYEEVPIEINAAIFKSLYSSSTFQCAECVSFQHTFFRHSVIRKTYQRNRKYGKRVALNEE